MHNKLDRLENNKDFIDWLKEHKCSDEMINGILEFNDEEFNRLKERIKAQPELLTAIVENGYGSEAINTTFCYGNDQMYNNFLRYKKFIIEFLKNKCPNNRLIYMYINNGSYYSAKVLKYKSLFIMLFKYFPHSESTSVSENNNVVHLLNDNELNLNKLINNLQLFRLLMINGISCDIVSSLVIRNDFETINVKNNKELLDFLLDEQLITLAQDKENLISDFWVSILLKIDSLTINELVEKSTDEIQSVKAKINNIGQTKIKEAQSYLPDRYYAKASELSNRITFEYNEGGVQSLQTLAVAKMISL